MTRKPESDRLEYLTENLYEVAYLTCKSFKVVGFIQQGRKIAIRFIKTPELVQASLDYFNGNGRASARELFDCFRRTKDAVFQNKNEGGAQK